MDVIPAIGKSWRKSFFKRDLIGIIIILGLGVMLTYNLVYVVNKFNFENSTRSNLTKEINAIDGGYVRQVRFNEENGKLIIRAVMRGPYEPDKNKVAQMETTIEPNYLKIPNELRIRFVKTEVITKEGKIFTDQD